MIYIVSNFFYMFPCTVKDPEGTTKQISLRFDILCELCLVRSATDDSENQNAHSERATRGPDEIYLVRRQTHNTITTKYNERPFEC